MAFIIVAAIGLYLILEGILPFSCPNLWRKMARSMMNQSNRSLHITGLVLMILGAIVIIIAHQLL